MGKDVGISSLSCILTKIIIIIIIAGIAVNETHLTATGIHMSMGSHGITRHPTEATSPPKS